MSERDREILKRAIEAVKEAKLLVCFDEYEMIKIDELQGMLEEPLEDDSGR